MMTGSEYERLAERHRILAAAKLGPALERLEWSADRIAEHRQTRLRETLCYAARHSAWHAKRLRGLDLDAFTEADLDSIEPMTKSDLMDHWDTIATDPGLGLARCEAQLDALDGPGYLDDRFHVIASGGSSGKRGVFAYDWEGWADYYVIYARWLARRVMRAAGSGAGAAAMQPTMASVGAYAFTHPTVALTRTFLPPGGAPSSFPVSLPLPEIVAGLNALRPAIVLGYASALALLAREARAGRLSISPAAIMTTSEPLLPEMATAIEAAFGVLPVNVYGTSDAGVVAMGCGESPGMHVSDDELIIEAVDEAGRPVPPGSRASKLYVTALFQRALPMIRYELSDETEWIDEPCPCGSSFRRIRDIEGRLDDTFVYAGDVAVHPHVFRSPLARIREVVEYQVLQSARGATIRVVESGPFDRRSLVSSIEAALAQLGIAAPEVSIEGVDHIARLGVGKLKRFVPVASEAPR